MARKSEMISERQIPVRDVGDRDVPRQSLSGSVSLGLGQSWV
jgi:hypothetical protein